MKKLIIGLLIVVCIAISGKTRAEDILYDASSGTFSNWGLIGGNTPWMFRFSSQSLTSKTWTSGVLETASSVYLASTATWNAQRDIVGCDQTTGVGCMGAGLLAWDLTSSRYEILDAMAGNTTSLAAAAGNTFLITHSTQWLFDGTNYTPQRAALYAPSTAALTREAFFIDSVNITTNTSTLVKASAGRMYKIVVGVAGTASSAKIYNDATTPCDTGLVGTIDTSSLREATLNRQQTTGICILTSGTAAADIIIVYE